MAVASIQVSETPLVLYTLRRADDALILGHRLSEWCGHAPMLEEDMALANMGLDLLGQARELYCLRRQGRRQGQRRRQIRLSARRQAVPQSPAAGTAERRFRAHHGAAVLLCGLRRSLLARDDEIDATRRWRRSRRNPRRKAPIMSGIRRNGSSGSATAPTESHRPRARPRSTISGPLPARCSRSTTASAP